MPLDLYPYTTSFAAEARGLDLSKVQDFETLQEIVEGLDRYAVMIFRGQSLSQAEQVAFARQLGPADVKLDEIMRKIQTRMEYAEVSDISNVDMRGEVARKNDRQAMMNIGNRIWHSDSSYMEYPWRYSILYAVTAVSWGGETQWADLRAAYDALDARTKSLIQDMIGEHYALQSRMVLGYTDNSPAEIEMFPPTRWPLIRTHPASGRKVLFVTNAIREIIGLSLPEGRQLVQDLIEHATQAQFVHSHKWAPGDLVIWDNRAVLHRGRRFNMSERREMRRVATVDDVRSLKIDEEFRTKVYGQPCI